MLRVMGRGGLKWTKVEKMFFPRCFCTGDPGPQMDRKKGPRQPQPNGWRKCTSECNSPPASAEISLAP